ncbi:expressed protein [Echinococcus multilocularis]|uniref:Expressed protein n=1 Tax=Echinococcus multilocularis TaxID=6211 RepID=A0A068Y7P0_ECHMU|nr:expressed protein [Echinococcus multilocularis]
MKYTSSNAASTALVLVTSRPPHLLSSSFLHFLHFLTFSSTQEVGAHLWGGSHFIFVLCSHYLAIRS